MNYNPLILTDFYKVCHHAQYNEDIEFITSYYTPRTTRIKQDEVVMFGLQSFLEEYFVEEMDSMFFSKEKEQVVNSYHNLLKSTIGANVANEASDRISELHDLGYLPIKVSAIKEGTLVPIKVPMLEITNTHPRFAWLVNALETLMSTSLWHGMISATVGYQYRQIANEWFERTVDTKSARTALGDFSFRGQESVESGIKSSAGFLLSGTNTATLPAIPYLAHYYNAEYDEVGSGAISTEHSVMCSNYSIDGDEITFMRKLVNELYPSGYVSIVTDSYDYWNMIDVILPSLKTDIMNRDGTIGIRGDSGDPVEIVAGKAMYEAEFTDEGLAFLVDLKHLDGKQIAIIDEETFLCEVKKGVVTSYKKMKLTEMPSSVVGTVVALSKNFPSIKNKKGYEVLDSHIRVVYGDGITQRRAEEIYSRLEKKGYSAENVTLGVGSFSMQAIEDHDGLLSPYTRDTFGVAIKATHGLMKDGREIFILKDPKTDSGVKKSLQGLIDVRMKDNELYAVDKVSINDDRDTIMETVFLNGKIKKQTLKEIRNRLHDNF